MGGGVNVGGGDVWVSRVWGGVCEAVGERGGVGGLMCEGVHVGNRE